MQAPPIRIGRIRLSQGHLFWREVGKGPTIIFLHGALTDGSQWLPVLEQLGNRVHCLAPDLLGFGESDDPESPQSIQLHADCLADYINALHLEEVYLVGHSIGAWIASRYAIAHPERVSGMILLAPEGVDVPDRRSRWHTELMLTSSIPVVPLGMKLAKPVTKWFTSHHRKVTTLLAYREQLLACPPSCHLLFNRPESEIAAELINDDLEALKTRILILQGGQDHPIQIRQSKTYVKLAPYAKLRMMKQGGWDLVEAWANNVVREIERFTIAALIAR
ncbi:alpha/beta hydrolase [Spirulina major CS-329]|uniref:alpha/beta fold hydrolase n=1 Tax=Spirulina TaxID=1154 RepID=UPI00232AF1C8|nr:MULTISPECIES: alpha/beta hydrolase [Spirulina]MDB9493007.1 alpha/beta hydrolase [Spirulina subsalsa CS-330]MDB9505227.1 alpha/beta hydrolase [Spirulina major CS-329]